MTPETSPIEGKIEQPLGMPEQPLSGPPQLPTTAVATAQIRGEGKPSALHSIAKWGAITGMVLAGAIATPIALHAWVMIAPLCLISAGVIEGGRELAYKLHNFILEKQGKEKAPDQKEFLKITNGLLVVSLLPVVIALAAKEQINIRRNPPPPTR